MREFPAAVIEELRTHLARVAVRPSAERLWNRLLTDEDRQRLGGDFDAAYSASGTVGMWMGLRGVSRPKAIADVAQALGLLDDTTHRWLLKEIGEPLQAHPRRDVPSWRPDLGQLLWGDRVIRDVRVMRKPSNIQLILDAFEAANWPPRIDDPLPDGPNQHRLHLTLQSLNSGLEVIRFHAQEGGSAIYWRGREIMVIS
jgi:hypothetical protein